MRIVKVGDHVRHLLDLERLLQLIVILDDQHCTPFLIHSVIMFRGGDGRVKGAREKERPTGKRGTKQ